MFSKNVNVLVVTAHPDDEVLGCAGTIARFIEEGCNSYTLILGEGLTSRDNKRQRFKREKEIAALKRQTSLANKILGVRKVFAYDFPDNRFDEISLLDIVKVIEKIKCKVKPNIVYTHHWNDLNIDHRKTYEAVLTACRPIKGETVKEIYSFEIASSTEWNYPYMFNPNIFVDIAKTFDKKIKALQCYSSELKDFPHPRSKEAVEAIAKRWGSLSGLKYAEAFELVRNIK